MSDGALWTGDFWTFADRLLAEHRLVIDRPKGSRHPRHPDYVYPLDYGFLEGTSGGDGAEIDVWLGSGAARVVGVFATLDPIKRDAEVKLAVGLEPDEIAIVSATMNHLMRALWIGRP